MATKSSARTQTYGIGAVSRLTGLTDHTIRVWERRYNAVDAERAANGRRIYTAADVEKLKLLKLLTDQGLSIGRIAAESLDALSERARELRDLSYAGAPQEPIAVALFGELLPALIEAEEQHVGPLDVVVVDNQEDRFLADLEHRRVDVLVVELAVLGEDTAARLERLAEAAGTRRVVCIYGFGRSADSETLRNQGVYLLRAPITIDEAVQAVIHAASASLPVAPVASAAEEESPDAGPWEAEGLVEPRLFTQHQLTTLANVSSAIECECPRHLAQLVGALSAFEIYSANCANRDDEDAALHRYLHRTTASARALVEQALERVARAEGLL